MLFARRNQAYVDDEEQAKKITFDRTIKILKHRQKVIYGSVFVLSNHTNYIHDYFL